MYIKLWCDLNVIIRIEWIFLQFYRRVKAWTEAHFVYDNRVKAWTGAHFLLHKKNVPRSALHTKNVPRSTLLHTYTTTKNAFNS
jgi:hypothetical protein